MVAQEPVKAAIWHSLNAYGYSDAIFLAERLFAEVHNEEVLHLLATSYYRAGHINRTYNILKKNTHTSIHNRYLFGKACYDLNNLTEAEASLLGCSHPGSKKSISSVASEYGSIAGSVLQLLGNIYRKSDQLQKSADCFKQSLKCNPFLWASFQNLCDIGEKIDPLDYFKTSVNFKTQHPPQNPYPFAFMAPRPQLSNLKNDQSYEQLSSENLDPAKSGPLLTSTVLSKPHQDLSSTNNNTTRGSVDLDLPAPPPISKMNRFGKARQRLLGSQVSDSPLTPSFGLLPADSPLQGLASPMFVTPPVPAAVSCKAPIKAPVKKGVVKKTETSHSRSSSYGYIASPSSNRSTPCSDNENISGLRRSSRLFGTNSASKDLKRTSKVHFAEPAKTAIPRKAKSRINRVANTQPLTPSTQNIIQTSCSMKKESNEDLLIKDTEPVLPSPIQQSADGLMNLLRDIGKAYFALTSYDSQKAVIFFNNLPLHQLSTCWLMDKLAIAYYEAGELNLAEKAFSKVRELDPYFIEEGMAIYSTLLWLSRKESLLSSLAQDLVDHQKDSPVAWCAMANCFSLQKEHDTAIKFLERAIQVDPGFAYSYSLLGHEYVYTEELERALSCFRSALRYNERHYNACGRNNGRLSLWRRDISECYTLKCLSCKVITDRYFDLCFYQTTIRIVIRYGIGMIYYKQEKYLLAKQHFERALKVNPKNSVLLCHLAVTQHDLGHVEEALETISKASEINPKNALCKYHKSRFLLAVDKTQEALTELYELKKLEPKDSLVFFMLGKAYQQIGETHNAQMNFSWAMSLDPQGTNTMIKEAMNQQRYVTDDQSFMQSDFMDEEEGTESQQLEGSQDSLLQESNADEIMSDNDL